MMQAQSKPSWLEDGNGGMGGGGGGISGSSHEDTSHVPLTSSSGIGQVEGMQQVSEDVLSRARYVHWGLRIVTMLLCVLMFVTACLGLGSVNGVDKSGKVFVAVYMLFFASLLFCFEAVQIQQIEWVEHMLRRNFGFLYSMMGKAFFIIFIAFLSLGLGDPANLSLATGLTLACFGAGELALLLKYPEFFEDAVISKLNIKK